MDLETPMTAARLTPVIVGLLAVLESPALAGKPVPTKADIPFGPHPHQLLDIYYPGTKGGQAFEPDRTALSAGKPVQLMTSDRTQ